MAETYKDKIIKRIKKFGNKKIFITADFFDIADYETVRKTLNRLVKEGRIQRVMKGLYYNPKYIEIINEYEAPSIHEIAIAIARKYNWNISPSGNTALNLLGLSTQVPAKWSYISDGRYTSINFNNNLIEFKRRNNGEISNMSPEIALIIQAIKALGNKGVGEKEIQHLKDKLPLEKKAELLESGKRTSQWIYKTIKAICEVD